MFQQKKIIFIDNANDKILEILEESIDKINDEKIILFSDILDKRSKLRNYLKKISHAVLQLAIKIMKYQLRK